MSKTRIAGPGLQALVNCPSLIQLILDGTSVTDESLAVLRKSKVVWLVLADTQIGDAGMLHLSRVPTLGFLNISDTGVTDAGLANIHRLPHLRDLQLDGTQITDASIDSLAKCPELRYLHIADTAITAAGRAKLKAASPDCEVIVTRSMY